MMPDTVPVRKPPREGFFLWRYAIVTGAVLSLGVLVIVRMVMMQIGPERQRLSALVSDGYTRNVPKPRGLIFDREGHLLAGNRAVYELDIYLPAVPADMLPDVAREIGNILGITVSQSELDDYKRTGVEYVQIFTQVTEEQKQRIEHRMAMLNAVRADAAKIDMDTAFQFHQSMGRYYPEGDLAANVLGFVSLQEGKGYGGVEQYYDTLLEGGMDLVRFSLVPWQEDEAAQWTHDEPAALYLTIDRALQHAAEEEARRAVQDSEARSASIIVADPYTGEILAMAVYPRPDLNDYDAIQAYINKWQAFNLALERPYEPGSVFKVITMAAALDLGVVTPETHYYDVGSFQAGENYTVYNWDRGAWGDQTMVTCLQHSLNTCLAWVAVERIGKDRFYDYMRAFGFGQNTGIDLAGEAPGFYYQPGKYGWQPAPASQAFGQTIYATPVQMVAAASAVANGGYLITPHVLRYDVIDGRAYRYQSGMTRQVLSAEAAHTLRLMLEESLKGESSTALVPGYSVAGKTGTAEISVGDQGYVTSDTNASFVGWFPAEEPQYLIYIWLERPQRSKWASIVAAPVFSRMVQRVAALERVPPDAVREQLEETIVSQTQP